MPESNEPYTTARGVSDAIKQAARRAAASDPSLTTDQRIQLEYFRRFLSRVFEDSTTNDWLLKGGLGVLARVTSSRATRDIDLHCNHLDLDSALEDLRRRASRDLGDHFQFEYLKHTPNVATDAQPYVHGYRVTFMMFIGVHQLGVINIDLVVGPPPTSQPSILIPVSSLQLPRLPSNAYRVFPVVDQIADKVCATTSNYHGHPSTREKDLVDLVVFANTQEIQADELRSSIDIERRRRGLEKFTHLEIPPKWGVGYNKLAAPIPCCEQFKTVAEAASLMRNFIDPVLDGSVTDSTWSINKLAWCP